ncbi:MAG TPA: adenylosuccinate synthase [Patescibacteria group bacterium]|nr:adenylosuccinate synthase [Patescibacteria group bacterium]
MPATVIVGGQWGDEGKAKIVDYLMHDHDVVIRYQGGANAGHTVVMGDGTFAFHQIPSGILHPHVTGILGNGMVIDPFAFIEELKGLVSRGVNVEGRLFISSAAQVVMFYHRVLDNLYESELKGGSIGSTGKGIGPAYADKYSRRGIRMGDFLLGKEELYELVRQKVEYNNRYMELFNASTFPAQKNASDFVNIKDLISHFIVDTQEFVFSLKEEGKRILLEGAQGTLLDIDHGTYPYVTSSSCSIGGAFTGSGLTPTDISRALGIFKAYVTRVGNGPFPTELGGGDGEMLRERGHEYGTTTGRPRRCGWLDLVAGNYAVRLNGLTEIALTKLDVLSGLPRIKYCVAYRLNGKEIRSFPQSAALLERCEPVYEELPGWSKRDLEVDSFEALPENARRYIGTIEDSLGVKVSFISNGPEREKTIIREPVFSVEK